VRVVIGFLLLKTWFGLGILMRFIGGQKGREELGLLGAFAKLRKAAVSFVMSVCPSVRMSAWINSAPTGRMFVKFDLNIF
jgi:hypothetical protein